MEPVLWATAKIIFIFQEVSVERVYAEQDDGPWKVCTVCNAQLYIAKYKFIIDGTY